MFVTVITSHNFFITITHKLIFNLLDSYCWNYYVFYLALTIYHSSLVRAKSNPWLGQIVVRYLPISLIFVWVVIVVNIFKIACFYWCTFTARSLTNHPHQKSLKARYYCILSLNYHKSVSFSHKTSWFLFIYKNSILEFFLCWPSL